MADHDDYGRDYSNGVKDTAEIKRVAARIAREEEERERNSRAWARLCGMAAPIGGPSSR